VAEQFPVDAWEDEVLATWGLAESPFVDAGSDAFFFPSEQHLRALDFMRRVLCSSASAGVISGVQGAGKSLLVRNFVAGLDSRILLAHVQRTDLSARDFLFEVLRQFGVELDRDDRTDRRLLLQRYLTHQVSNGRICLLVVENAQAMQPQVLDEVLNLALLQLDGSRLIKLLLLGQPMLTHVVDSPRLAGLVPASVPRVTIGGLSEDQLAAYVAHRLRVAGARDPDRVFPHALIPVLHRLTAGVPAVVNKLCGRALAVAAVDGMAEVTLDSLLNAAGQLGYQFDGETSPATRSEYAVPETEVTLLISARGGQDAVIKLHQSRMLIGRSELADVCIDSAFVSRYHALIVREPEQDLLIDLGSTNGMLVNAKRVRRHRLQNRDLIQIGPARITYLNPEQLPAATVDGSQTMQFARPDAANNDHSVFAFGRFEDAG
jgi:general secretion pathway protein A